MTQNEILEEAKRIIKSEIASVERLLSTIQSTEIEKAVRLCQNAKKCIVTGVGKSGAIAVKIAATFSSVGTPAMFLHPTDALHGDIGIVENGDVAIVLSNSGTTNELLTLIPFLKGKGAKVISIVGTLDSPIAAMSDAVLDATVDSEACSLNLAPSNSTTVALVLGDVLALTTMKAKNFTPTDFAKSHPMGQLGKSLTVTVEHAMHSDASLPIVSLGASAKATILEISNKQLGCVCVVDGEALVGFVTDGDIRRAFQKFDDIRDVSVQEIMTHKPLIVTKSMLLGEVLSIMESGEQQISVAPVVDENYKLVGVIRLHDILRY